MAGLPLDELQEPVGEQKLIYHRNALTSPLLRLPFAIRKRILQHAFSEPGTIFFDCHPAGAPCPLSSPWCAASPHQVSARYAPTSFLAHASCPRCPLSVAYRCRACGFRQPGAVGRTVTCAEHGGVASVDVASLVGFACRELYREIRPVLLRGAEVYLEWQSNGGGGGGGGEGGEGGGGPHGSGSGSAGGSCGCSHGGGGGGGSSSSSSSGGSGSGRDSGWSDYIWTRGSRYASGRPTRPRPNHANNREALLRRLRPYITSLTIVTSTWLGSSESVDVSTSSILDSTEEFPCLRHLGVVVDRAVPAKNWKYMSLIAALRRTVLVSGVPVTVGIRDQRAFNRTGSACWDRGPRDVRPWVAARVILPDRYETVEELEEYARDLRTHMQNWLDEELRERNCERERRVRLAEAARKRRVGEARRVEMEERAWKRLRGTSM